MGDIGIMEGGPGTYQQDRTEFTLKIEGLFFDTVRGTAVAIQGILNSVKGKSPFLTHVRWEITSSDDGLTRVGGIDSPTDRRLQYLADGNTITISDD